MEWTTAARTWSRLAAAELTSRSCRTVDRCTQSPPTDIRHPRSRTRRFTRKLVAQLCRVLRPPLEPRAGARQDWRNFVMRDSLHSSCSRAKPTSTRRPGCSCRQSYKEALPYGRSRRLVWHWQFESDRKLSSARLTRPRSILHSREN